MEHQLVPVSLLDGHARNYRKHPPEQIKRLAASLKRFQQVRSIVVRRKVGTDRYIVLAGHGVVEAARECYLPQLACDIVPDSWTDADCEAYLIADNLHAQGGHDDEVLLAQLLEEQEQMGADLAALGSHEAALHDMLAKAAPPTFEDIAEQYGEEEPEEDAFWPVIRIKVAPETKARFDELMEEAEGKSEADRFAWILDQVA
jgi:ParB-like chromosome segregation protein Spo0J